MVAPLDDRFPPMNATTFRRGPRSWSGVVLRGLFVCFFQGFDVADGLTAPVEECPEVSRRIAAEGRISHRISSWERLAPYLPADGIPPLLAALSEPETAFEAGFALGASRRAEVLAALRLAPPAADPVAGALALLALGEPSQTATVTEALYRGGVAERRRVALALRYMRQARPRLLLLESLEDRDPQVRLSAARVHAQLGNRRARKVLEEILESGPRRLRAEAARVLFRIGTTFSPNVLARLPNDLRGAAMARHAFRASRSGLRTLRIHLRARDQTLRAGVVAAIAIRQEMTLRQFTRWVRRSGAGPARMARVIAGDTTARAALERLPPLHIPRALEVVAALRGLPPPAARLDREIGLAVAGQVAPWLGEAGVSQDLQVRVLKTLAQSEPDAGRFVARSRLLGKGGEGLVAAAEVLADVGGAEDVESLLGRAVRADSDEDRVSLLAAAGRLCAR